MSFWSFFINISTYIINHLFLTMLAYCPEFNHYWVSKHYINELSKPSPHRALTYLRQSLIKKTVAVFISTNKVKNLHWREHNTNHLRLPRNWFSSNDQKRDCALLSSAFGAKLKACWASSFFVLVSCLIKYLLNHDARLPTFHTFQYVLISKTYFLWFLTLQVKEIFSIVITLKQQLKIYSLLSIMVAFCPDLEGF